MPNLLSFLSYLFITTFTPGPNNIMSMTNASRYGFKKSMRFNYGVFVGFVIIMVLCMCFSSGLYYIIPSIKIYLKVLGAAYILYLAYKTIKSDYSNKEVNHGSNSFLSGMVLQFINVKVILYGITIISTFITPYYTDLVVLLFFAFLLALVGFISTCSWSLFGSVFQKLFIRHTKIVNIVMTILLVYCAISIFH